MNDTASHKKPASQSPAPAGNRHGQHWLMATSGALVAAGIVTALTVATSFTSARIDWTANSAHSLTDATQNIIQKLDSEVVVKLYVTPGDDQPAPMRPLLAEVESRLALYRELNPDFIKVVKAEVATDTSDEAEEARIDGIQRMGNLYFGISITCLDKKTVIPWVPELLPSGRQDRDDQFEYQISRAITEVFRPQQKTVGIMSPLKVSGTPGAPPGYGPPQWAISRELKSLYKVIDIDTTADTIADNVDVLVVIHPGGFSDSTLYAIDQFLLKGKSVVAFLDPSSIVAQSMSNPQNPMAGGVPVSSNMKKLLETWGYSFASDKLISDPTYALNLGGGQRPMPVPYILHLSGDSIAKNEELTRNLTDFIMVYGSAFTGSPATGITEKRYLTTSAKAGSIDTRFAMAQPGSEEFVKNMAEMNRTFVSEGKQQILAMRLSGRFKTAFAGGKPAKEDPPPQGGGLPPGFSFPGANGAQGTPGTEAPPPPAAETPAPVVPGTETPAATPPPPAATAEVPAAAPEPPAAVPAPGAADAATPPVPPATATPVVPAGPEGASTPPVAVPQAPAAPPAAAPADPNQLKESAADGLVYLVGDTDIICDQLRGVFTPSNFYFAMNMIDEAAGEKELMNIRSRGTSRRPFTKMNEIEEEARASSRDAEKKAADAIVEFRKQLTALKEGPERSIPAMKSQEELENKLRDAETQQYQAVKAANNQIRSVKNRIKWINVLIAPHLIIITGLVVFLINRSRTSAR